MLSNTMPVSTGMNQTVLRFVPNFSPAPILLSPLPLSPPLSLSLFLTAYSAFFFLAWAASDFTDLAQPFRAAIEMRLKSEFVAHERGVST